MRLTSVPLSETVGKRMVPLGKHNQSFIMEVIIHGKPQMLSTINLVYDGTMDIYSRLFNIMAFSSRVHHSPKRMKFYSDQNDGTYFTDQILIHTPKFCQIVRI